MRSHHDAWLVGKPGLVNNKPSTEIPRDPPRGCLMEVMAPANQGSDHTPPRGAGAVDGNGGRDRVEGQGHGQGHQPRTSCIVCLKEQQLLQQLQQQKPSHGQRRAPSQPALPPGSMLRPVNVSVNDTFNPPGGGEGPVAPPASPDFSAAGVGSDSKSPPPHRRCLSPSTTANHSNANRLLSRRPGASPRYEPAVGVGEDRPEPWSEGWGEGGQGDAFNSDSESSSQDSGGSKRKLRVRVFLPKVAPDPAEEDIRVCLLQGKPVLARERPLSHSDLKGERRESAGASLDGDTGNEQFQSGGSRGEDFEDAIKRKSENRNSDFENQTKTDGESRDRCSVSEQKEKNVRNQNGNENTRSGRRDLADHHQHHQHHKNSNRTSDEVGDLSGGDSDSDHNSKDSLRRAPLHTHPVTIRRAETDDCQQHDE